MPSTSNVTYALWLAIFLGAVAADYLITCLLSPRRRCPLCLGASCPHCDGGQVTRYGARLLRAGAPGGRRRPDPDRHSRRRKFSG